MIQQRPPSPARATIFYSTLMFTLITMGSALQRQFGLPGEVAMKLTLFCGVPLLFALYADERPLRGLFRFRWLSWRGWAKSLLLGLLAWGLAQALSFLSLIVVESLGGHMYQPYQDLMQTPFLVAFFTAGLLPAICEEVAFRGYLQHNLSPLGSRAAILITGLLFGLMHLSLIRALPLSVLGIIFAIAVQRTGSILPGILLHLVNNLTVLSLSFGLKVPPEMESASVSGAPSIVTVLFLLAAVVGLGAAVWAVVRRMGVSDLAQPGEYVPPAEADGPMAGPRRRLQWVVTLLPLLPAALIYAWAVSYELGVVFGQ